MLSLKVLPHNHSSIPCWSARICKQEEDQSTESAPEAEHPSLCVCWVHAEPYTKSALGFCLFISRARILHQQHKKHSREIFHNGEKEKVNKAHTFIGSSFYQLQTVVYANHFKLITWSSHRHSLSKILFLCTFSFVFHYMLKTSILKCYIVTPKYYMHR